MDVVVPYFGCDVEKRAGLEKDHGGSWVRNLSWRQFLDWLCALRQAQFGLTKYQTLLRS